MGYPVYSEYRESEIEWLDAVPAHWKVKRLKFVAKVQPSNVDKKTEEGENPVLLCNYVDVYKNERITNALSFMQATATQDEIDKFAVDEGDVIVTKDSETPFDIAVPALVSEVLDNVVCGYHLTQIKPIKIQGNYLFRLFQSARFNAQFVVRANGVTRFGLPQYVINDAAVCLPSAEEQQTIARFLDHKTAQIDALIAKKEALLQKLTEKRTALISQAVTQGLDPTVPIKDAGVAWQGKIPKDWKQVSLARAIAKIEQGWSPSCEERIAASDEWGVLKSGCINGGVFRESDHKTLPADIAPPKALEVKAGDILMCRASGSKHLIGSVAEVETCRPQLIFSDKTYRITLNASLVTSEFFTLAMGSRYLRDQIELSISGADGLANNIPQSSVKAYKFLAPPLSEQQELVSILSIRLAPMAKTELSVRTAIDKLKEYRAALITAAVTGKIDVRDVALPAEVRP